MNDFDAAFDSARRQVGGQGVPPKPPKDGESGSFGLPPDCPVTPLGHADGRYAFFDSAGQYRILPEEKLGNSAVLVSLFGGNAAWPTAAFPQHDQQGNPTGWFSARACGRWLVEECHASHRGLLREDERQRGLGVWRAEGRLTVHLGDVVHRPQDRDAQGRPVPPMSAGFRAWGALWPARPRGATIGDPAPAWLCRCVEGTFRRWNWEQPDVAPRLVTGLLATGLLGAGHRWRSHGLVVGQAGSGKSTLFDAVLACSPMAMVWNDYTPAGLQQALTDRAAPILLDEGEGDIGGADRIQGVIEFLRRVSGGAGLQGVRGSPGGKSRSLDVTAQALLGAILPPALLPQDESRFTRIDLLPRAPENPSPEDVRRLLRAGRDPLRKLPGERHLHALRRLAPRLLGRMLHGFGRFEASFDLYRNAMMRRDGVAPRMGDQLGTLLAARHALLFDAPPTAFQVDKALGPRGWVLPLLDSNAAGQVEAGGAVLLHLLQSSADVTRHGERPTFGRLIGQAMHDPAPEDARRLLRDHGLAIAPWPAPDGGVPGGPLHLFVANGHPRLAKVFEGTRWANSRWREDFRRMPGACVPESGRRELGPGKPRCTIIPAPQVEREGLSADSPMA